MAIYFRHSVEAGSGEHNFEVTVGNFLGGEAARASR
jgi:hypothetical protein